MILPFLIAWFATKINCHQGHVIAYLHEENRILKGKLKGKRIHLTDVERRRLALLAHPIDRKEINDISTIASADTLQRWYRRLVVPSPSSTLRDNRLGRPRVSEEIEQLAVGMVNVGRRLCAQGRPLLSLICHGIGCLPGMVLQQWYTCWSACRSLFDIHDRLFTDRRPCTSGRMLPTLHLVVSPSATWQSKTRPTERERDPPAPDALELAAVTRRPRSSINSEQAAA